MKREKKIKNQRKQKLLLKSTDEMKEEVKKKIVAIYEICATRAESIESDSMNDTKHFIS